MGLSKPAKYKIIVIFSSHIVFIKTFVIDRKILRTDVLTEFSVDENTGY